MNRPENIWRGPSRAMGLLLLLATSLAGQNAILWQNLVRHADGSLCLHIPPRAGFVAYLNGNEGRVLFHTAPRWDPGDPPIPGNGTFSVELGNFVHPAVQVGDSVFVRFTCLATGQQGELKDQVTGIPWLVFPRTLQLQPISLPATVTDVHLLVDSLGVRHLSWTAQAGTSYRVYRRDVRDTVHTGAPRMLYEQIAAGLTTGSYVDPSPPATGNGYVVVPERASITGLPSVEVNDLPPAPQNVKALLRSLYPLQVELNWKLPPGSGNQVLRYRIYRSTSPGVNLVPANLIGETDQLHFLDAGVQPMMTYYYRVASVIGADLQSEPSDEASLRTLQPRLPTGFAIQVYQTEDIDHPSGMALGPDGNLYVCEVASGEIKVVHDLDGNGLGDSVSVFARGFTQPVGLAWKGDSLYVSWRGSITILRDTDGDGQADWQQTIISGWPCFWHQNNQLVFDSTGHFLVALGSWADRTTGPSIYNNTIMRISPDGSQIQIWAEGIRNVYDMAFSPRGHLFGGDNGWQEHTPGGQPEELNLYRPGRHYGYPDFLGFPPPGSGTAAPAMLFPDHSAPTGLLFYQGANFPSEYQGDLLMAFYGPDQWQASYLNRAYRIMRCEIQDTTVLDTTVFASHFFRPIDLVLDQAGALLVADLGQFWPPEVDGHIFKIYYQGPAAVFTSAEIPARFRVGRNFPNPFNGQTWVPFELGEPAPVEVAVYDVKGNLIFGQSLGHLSSGAHRWRWPARNREGKLLPSGVYFYRFRVGGRWSSTGKMVFIR